MRSVIRMVQVQSVSGLELGLDQQHPPAAGDSDQIFLNGGSTE